MCLCVCVSCIYLKEKTSNTQTHAHLELCVFMQMLIQFIPDILTTLQRNKSQGHNLAQLEICLDPNHWLKQASLQNHAVERAVHRLCDIHGKRGCGSLITLLLAWHHFRLIHPTPQACNYSCSNIRLLLLLFSASCSCTCEGTNSHPRSPNYMPIAWVHWANVNCCANA